MNIKFFSTSNITKSESKANLLSAYLFAAQGRAFPKKKLSLHEMAAGGAGNGFAMPAAIIGEKYKGSRKYLSKSEV